MCTISNSSLIAIIIDTTIT